MFKRAVLYALCLFSCACSSKFVGKPFAYVGTSDYTDFEILLCRDSSFIFQDKTGCVRIAQKGTWRVVRESQKDKTQFVYVFLESSPTIETGTGKDGRKQYAYHSNFDAQTYIYKDSIPLIVRDTLLIINQERMAFRGLSLAPHKGDLLRKRLKRTEMELIEKIGRRAYVQTIGEGRSRRKARQNLRKCYMSTQTK